jgi:hypothetical protein
MRSRLLSHESKTAWPLFGPWTLTSCASSKPQPRRRKVGSLDRKNAQPGNKTVLLTRCLLFRSASSFNAKVELPENSAGSHVLDSPWPGRGRTAKSCQRVPDPALWESRILAIHHLCRRRMQVVTSCQRMIVCSDGLMRRRMRRRAGPRWTALGRLAKTNCSTHSLCPPLPGSSYRTSFDRGTAASTAIEAFVDDGTERETQSLREVIVSVASPGGPG